MNTSNIIELVEYELHGQSAGEDSRGYKFSLPACSNVSEASRGHIQGWERTVKAIVADGATYLAPEDWTFPEYGPGLRDSKGRTYRDGNLWDSATAAVRRGILVLID